MKFTTGALVAAAMLACVPVGAAPAKARATAPRAEVVHWWTSGGESAALKVIAAHYRAAGGIWIDTAVIGAEQARAVGVNRIIGGNPPAAAQFNTSKQFVDLIEEDMLEDVDEIARRHDWDRTLPEPVRKVIKVNGHYYAVPVSIHMPTWIWYSKAAFRKAGIARPPASMDDLFAALDKLKAAGLVPLAHGGQPWQEHIMFMAVLANMVDRDTYLKALRDKDARTIRSEPFRKALLAFKRLHNYVDAGTRGRTWNEASAMLLRGEAGVQIMGDWVKAEITTAGMTPGEEIGCIAAFGDRAPLVIQGDAFIFPKSERTDVRQAQKLLSAVMVAPRTQLEFSRVKGAVPLNASLEGAGLDACTREAVGLVKATSRHVGNTETYVSPGQNNEIESVLIAYWNTNMTVEAAQQGIIAALQR